MRKETKHNELTKKSLREDILQSMLASFKIEGIDIPKDSATTILKKIETTLGR